MTIDEAIEHATDVSQSAIGCDCREEHRQLAEWLKDYKRLKEQEPCEDAVSRQAIIDEMERRHANGDHITKGFVKNMPSVTPTRPKGHWVYDYTSADGHKVYHCSECGCYFKPKHSEPFDNKEGLPSWLGKNCKDCGNEKCKKLGTLPKGYDCALWQPKVENYSIKTVTNAKEAENYPISEDISKSVEEINKLIFEKGQAESEVKQ